jgi:hypothetical protein
MKFLKAREPLPFGFTLAHAFASPSFGNNSAALSCFLAAIPSARVLSFCASATGCSSATSANGSTISASSSLSSPSLIIGRSILPHVLIR